MNFIKIADYKILNLDQAISITKCTNGIDIRLSDGTTLFFDIPSESIEKAFIEINNRAKTHLIQWP